MSDSAPPAAPADEGGQPVLLRTEPVRATWALVAANVALFALETAWGGSESSPTLYRMGSIAGRGTLAVEPWRVLSSAFLHIGFVHLLLNMWALYVFGRFLEALLGAWRLLVLYAAAAAGGGLASTLAREQSLAAGASGAVWGLMLAEVVLLLRPRVLFDDIVFTVNKWAVLQPLLFNLVYSLQPGIDLVAHLGGGATGGLVMATGVLARDPRGRRWRAAALAAAVLMGTSIALALAAGRPWELRAPVLETRTLPGNAATLPVPRGLDEGLDGETVTYGSPRHDPIAVECRATRFDPPMGPEETRGELERLVAEAGARPLDAPARRVEEWAVVEVAGRPAAHQAYGYPNGVRVDMWYLSDGVTALRLEVVLRPDAPQAWRALPAQIARGVSFRSGAASTAPAPSSPGLPPPPAAPGPPRPR